VLPLRLLVPLMADYCRCTRLRHYQCLNLITAEDLLCDDCRQPGCIAAAGASGTRAGHFGTGEAVLDADRRRALLALMDAEVDPLVRRLMAGE
jgi:hypothetical protein